MNLIDPRAFDPAIVDSETAELNSKIEKELSALPPIYTFKPPDIRAARAAGNSIWGPIRHAAEAQDRMIAGPAGEIRLRLFVPDEIQAVYLHMHGGGFMLGQADYFDERLSAVAQKCHVAVVSVDYRLAPENPSALFTVGTLDPLIDDSLFMHLRWQAAGNPSELAIYPGGIHAFDAFPIELARKAHARIREFMIRMSND